MAEKRWRSNRSSSETPAAGGPARRSRSSSGTPDLAEDLTEQQLALARRQVRAEVIAYPAGPWDVGPDDVDGTASLGLLVIDGLMAREVTVGDYTYAELLGPGDLIQPWLPRSPRRSSGSLTKDAFVRCRARAGCCWAVHPRA